MRHWSLLGTRNLRVKPGRTAGAALAVALGVAIVVWITSAYQSFIASIGDQIQGWVGRSQISVEPSYLDIVDEGLIAPIRALENVRTVCPKAKFACRMEPSVRGPQPIDAIGIDPDSEYQLRAYRGLETPLTRTARPVDGRLLTAADRGRCMIEDALAAAEGLDLGDTVRLSAGPNDAGRSFTIVGRYVQRRISQFQRPTLVVLLDELQAVTGQRGQVSVIDVLLHDDSIATVNATAKQIEAIVSARGGDYPVNTAEARMRQVNNARDMSEFILNLMSAVALLTSMFIVVTTLSMGMIERITHMGMMRCAGMSRLQMAVVTGMEIVPIGVIGVIAGIPIGIGLAMISVRILPEYLQELVISPRGLWIGGVGGLATALLSGLVPAVQAAAVSPLAATKPMSRTPRPGLALVAAVVGLALIGLHELALATVPGHWWFNEGAYTAGLVTLFGGYALLAPAAARWASNALSPLVAALLRIRRPLLHDQIASTPWRSGAICTGFMVALSLVIGLTAHVDSVMAGWDFPTKIPEGFVWMMNQMPAAQLAQVRAMPGVKDLVGATNFVCRVDSPNKSGAAVSRFPLSMFVALDVRRFLQNTQLEYLEGDPDDAMAKMAGGGCVLVPQDAANILGLHAGDLVPITAGRTRHEFEVAGVVRSPSLDVAAVVFKADQQLMKASGSSIIGSLEDAQQIFNVQFISLLLLNLDMPAEVGDPPALFEQDHPPRHLDLRTAAQLLVDWGPQLPEYAADVAAIDQWLKHPAGQGPPAEFSPLGEALNVIRSYFWYELTPQQRWQRFKEQVILHRIKFAVDRPNALTGSVRLLKEMIDREVYRTSRLISIIPIIGLIVVALGAGNLMMANVAVRIRQIAVLRAIGASRSQVIRLILAEALILGVLGSALGLLAGLHLGRSINAITLAVWGFDAPWTMPWDMVGLGIGLTLGVCLIAGVLPARYAARNNIIAAMAAT